MAEILEDTIRSTDIAGRWGGEEFIIICPETTKTDTKIVAEKVKEQYSKTYFQNS